MWTHAHRVPSSDSDQALLRPPGADAAMVAPDSRLTRNRPVEVPSPVGQKTNRPFADQMGTEKSPVDVLQKHARLAAARRRS